MKKLILLAAFAAIGLSGFAQTTNYSLQFDGTDDYIQFGTLPAVQGGGYTIEGWIKTNLNSARTIFNAYEPGVGPMVYLEIRETGKLRFLHRNPAGSSGGVEVFSSKVVTDNLWHHFAAVRQDDGALWLYIDGFADAMSCSFSSAISILPTYEMGKNSFSPSEAYRHFKGYMDDFHIWNYARTPLDIYKNYKKEMAGTETGLFANYKFDFNNSPCDVVDCSNNHRHGTRYGVNGQFNLPQYSNVKPSGLKNLACGVNTCPQQTTTPPTTIETISEPEFEDFDLADDEDFALKVSPNPASNSILISLATDAPTKVNIFGADGRLVQETSTAGGDVFIDISTLSKGTYFVSAGEDWNYRVGKFIKQ